MLIKPIFESVVKKPVYNFGTGLFLCYFIIGATT